MAARVRTSRPVLYRRSPNRADLAVAAIRHVMQKHPVNAPDTGNVRGDLIALLQQFSKNRALFAVFFSLQMSGIFFGDEHQPGRSEDECASGHRHGALDVQSCCFLRI